MLNFLSIKVTFEKKTGLKVIEPSFIILEDSDLMVLDKEFHAVWDEEHGLWSKDIFRCKDLINNELYAYRNKNYPGDQLVMVKDLDDYDNLTWVKFTNFIKHHPDNVRQLDRKVVFADQNTTRSSYASFKLDYSMANAPTPCFDKLMDICYEKADQEKIMWFAGSIIDGASKRIQKFLVLYGEVGTGKGTIINLLMRMFGNTSQNVLGYTATFDAESLGDSKQQFATAAFKSNPLVAFQPDGKLDRIETNAVLNKITSHEFVPINEKQVRIKPMCLDTILIMGTNNPVRITDARSGLLRRVVDASPTGRKIGYHEYQRLKNGLNYELGGIAYKCLTKFREMGEAYYENYRPVKMQYATDPTYNFISDRFDYFMSKEGVTLTDAYSMYKLYMEECGLNPMTKMRFGEELKAYYASFKTRTTVDGARVSSYYSGFKREKFTEVLSFFEEQESGNKKEIQNDGEDRPGWIELKEQPSLLDEALKFCPAQYTNEDEKTCKPWDSVDTVLRDIDTSRTHYVLPPKTHVVFDFDKKSGGSKSLLENLKAAEEFPETYAETSKGGQGLHLSYNYTGDIASLPKYWNDDPEIEIKVFKDKAPLRRRVRLCNDKPVATISSLPVSKKERKKNVVKESYLVTNGSLVREIRRNLNKEVHPHTVTSVSMIKKILDDAYDSGQTYDVRHMRDEVFDFACNSHNSSKESRKYVSEMHFCSKDVEDGLVESRIDESNGSASVEIQNTSNMDLLDTSDLYFVDCEVYPNFNLVCYKKKNCDCVALPNPSPDDIKELLKHKIVTFNGLEYDNHVLFAIAAGESKYDVYQRSKMIVSGIGGKTPQAKGVSYLDVYELSQKKDRSLKKWEILLKIPHRESEIDWDKPIRNDQIQSIIEYCFNDVRATEAVFDKLIAKYYGRLILSELTGLPVYTRTNKLSEAFIFEGKKPDLWYTDLKTGKMYNSNGDLVGQGKGFPHYEYKWETNNKGLQELHNYNRGDDISKGGRVLAKPGMYIGLIDLFDVTSMHPHSIKAMNLFGAATKRYCDIIDFRIAVKEGRLEDAGKMFDGICAKYLVHEELQAAIAQAFKDVINPVYGMTFMGYKNAFKDPRNVNNIVACRGALFIDELVRALEEKGYNIIHVKVDSFKVTNADEEMVRFVDEFAAEYGYHFDHEAQYDRIALLNNAVYAARYSDWEGNGKHPAGSWTSTGTETSYPYTFKKLFSGEDIVFDDLCEIKSVSGAGATMYLDMNEGMEDTSKILDQSNKLLKKAKKETDEGKKLEMLNTVRDMDIEMSKQHKYVFIGKVGSFCPIKPGMGGGELMRYKGNNQNKLIPRSYSSVTGTIGYRWLESMDVEGVREGDIDFSFFDDRAESTKRAIIDAGKSTCFDWWKDANDEWIFDYFVGATDIIPDKPLETVLA